MRHLHAVAHSAHKIDDRRGAATSRYPPDTYPMASRNRASRIRTIRRVSDLTHVYRICGNIRSPSSVAKYASYLLFPPSAHRLE
jgi:hypothetical protein